VALHIIRSNRMEVLAHILSTLLARPAQQPADPMAPLRVAVGSRGMAEWLQEQLAYAHGIASHLDFPFPRHALRELAKALGGHDEDPWAPESLRWTLLSLLQELANEPVGAELAAYELSFDPVDARTLELATRVATLFDRYAAWRPSEVAQGFLGDGWQAALWRMAERELGEPPHLLSTLERINRASESELQACFDQPVRLFGLSSMAPAVLNAFASLARAVDVELYLLVPSHQYWADLRSRRVALKPLSTMPRDELPEALREALDGTPSAEGHPLLASFGRVARDFQIAVESLPIDYIDRTDVFVDQPAFPDPAELPSSLHLLQSDILHLRHPLAWTSDQLAERPMDDSVQFHSCHGPLRQVEILRDLLLGLMHDHPEIEPRDILVLTPDIDAMAPRISAVFGVEPAPGDGPSIPWRVADRSVRRTNPHADALVRLLRFASGVERLSASQVLDLLALPPVARRFGLDPSELPTFADWIHRAGVRWGASAEDRARAGQPEDPLHTWRFGLERLLLAVAIPDHPDRLVADSIVPLGNLSTADQERLGRFVHAVSTVFELVESLRTPSPLGPWLSRLRDPETGASARLLEPDDSDRRGWRALQRVLDQLALGAATELPISVHGIRTLLESRMDQPSGSPWVSSGAVTFARFLPFRSVPYKVVVLLGMDEDAFPRKGGGMQVDLVRASRRAGDPDPRDEDRALLLEAIMSARNFLLVLYSGRDARTNEPLPPAVPVGELMDVLQAASAEGTLQIRQHALQPFGIANFQAPSFSYSTTNAALSHTEPQAPPPFLADLKIEQESLKELGLPEFIRLLRQPAKVFATERLGLSLAQPQELELDADPLEVNRLAEWRLGRALVDTMSGGADLEVAAARLMQSGELPAGTAGTEPLKVLLERAKTLDSVMPWSKLAPDHVQVEIDGLQLAGAIPATFQNRIYNFRLDLPNAQDMVSTWVHGLVRAAVHGPQDLRWVWMAEGSARKLHMQIEGPEFAREQLSALVAMARRAWNEPVPYAEKVAWNAHKHLLGTQRFRSYEYKALKTAKERWFGWGFWDFEERKRYPEFERLWPHRDPIFPIGGQLTPVMTEWTAALLEPVLRFAAGESE